MSCKRNGNQASLWRAALPVAGRYNVPCLGGEAVDLTDLEMVSFSEIVARDRWNRHRAVHFFLDDRRFARVVRFPERYARRLAQYRFVLSPDCSVYADMPRWQQVQSVAQNRLCGAIWQRMGLTVVPTVSWSDALSFEFCFDGLERGSTVAVGTVGCKAFRAAFMRGYRAMLERVAPRQVICYGTPFPEMEGNLTVIRREDTLMIRKRRVG